MHNYNCSICWPKEAPQYQDKFESYQNLIKSEIDSLSISYQSKLRLEQTVTEVLRTIYFSNRSSELYITPQPDYRAEEKIKGLESKYGNLLYDYEHERKLREELEKDQKQLQTKVLYLTEFQQECVQKHVGHSRVTELYNEIDSVKIQNKELFEENRYFKVKYNESETMKHQIKVLNDEIRYLKFENSEKDSVNTQAKELFEENRILRSKVGENSELNEKKRSLQAELERKDKRITQILQELEYYKDLHDNFKKEYMKDSSSITQKYEKVLREKQELQQTLSDLKENYRKLSRKFQNLNQSLESKESQLSSEPKERQLSSEPRENHLRSEPRESQLSSEPNGFTFKSKKNQPIDLEGSKKLKELEKRLDELKGQVEEKSLKKGENSLRNSTPTTVPNMSGYNTWNIENVRAKRGSEDNECILIEEEEGGKSEKRGNESRKRNSGEFVANNQHKRRNSEMTPTFSSLYRKSLSPSRGDQRSVTNKGPAADHISCRTCKRKHGQDRPNTRN